MIINTMHFGEVEIEDNSIITFEEGLPGFDEVKKFVILSSGDENIPFNWLQAVDQPHPAFAIINPFEIKNDYEFEIDDLTQEYLDIKDEKDLAVYSIVVIPEDITKMSTNLKAPVIINTANNRGRQMIMDSNNYEIKHYILDELVKVNQEESGEAK